MIVLRCPSLHMSVSEVQGGQPGFHAELAWARLGRSFGLPQFRPTSGNEVEGADSQALMACALQKLARGVWWAKATLLVLLGCSVVLVNPLSISHGPVLSPPSIQVESRKAEPFPELPWLLLKS